MLILKRKIGQAIVINGNIRVICLRRISLTKLSIGIDAPDDVHIVREELLGMEEGSQKVNILSRIFSKKKQK